MVSLKSLLEARVVMGDRRTSAFYCSEDTMTLLSVKVSVLITMQLFTSCQGLPSATDCLKYICTEHTLLEKMQAMRRCGLGQDFVLVEVRFRPGFRVSGRCKAQGAHCT